MQDPEVDLEFPHLYSTFFAHSYISVLPSVRYFLIFGMHTQLFSLHTHLEETEIQR